MSATGEVEGNGPVTRFKESLFDGYMLLRRYPWVAGLLIGVGCLGIGYVLDPGVPPIDHGTFAAIFALWGVSAILAAIGLLVAMRLLYFWNAHVDHY